MELALHRRKCEGNAVEWEKIRREKAMRMEERTKILEAREQALMDKSTEKEKLEEMKEKIKKIENKIQNLA